MMKKIVIIDHEPFTIRRKAIFYVDELIKRGFEVEFWDCSQFFYKGIRMVDEISAEYVKKIDSLISLENCLKGVDCRHSVFIVEVHNTWKNRRFFKLLVKKGCYLVKQEMYATAGLTVKESLAGRLVRMSLTDWKKLIRSCTLSQISAYYRRIFRLRFNLLVSSGNAPDIDVYINHPDWELARSLKKDNFLPPDQKYAVFMDEYFPLHPDLKYSHHLSLEGEQESYRKKLCHFFTYIEQEYGVEVVIAAHPKSDYDEEYWEGRKCYKYKTPELVRDAQMVFLHGSAAISYVVIFNKPLTIFTTDEYEKARQLNVHVRRLSDLVGLPVYNIDRSFHIECRRLDKEVRDHYVYTYLTHKEIEEKENIDILSELYTRLP